MMVVGSRGCLSLSKLTSRHPEPVAEETEAEPFTLTHLVCNQPTPFEMWEETGVPGENPCRPGKSTQHKCQSGSPGAKSGLPHHFVWPGKVNHSFILAPPGLRPHPGVSGAPVSGS
ncbi:uncharacterized protein LOC144208253 [Stigmatopora nigra]